MSEAQKRAQGKYEGKRKIKPVSFNRDEEKDLLAFADAMTDFSGWVKQMLREKMENQDGQK